MKQFAGFTALRVLGTLLSYGIYLALLPFMNYEIAYVIAYVSGIAIAYSTNSKMLFKREMNRKSAFLFTASYAVQFVISWIILKVCVEIIGVPEIFALAVSVVAMLPISYVLSKWAILRH